MDARSRVKKCVTVSRRLVFSLVFRSDLDFATTGFENWKRFDNKVSSSDRGLQNSLSMGIGRQEA